MARPAVQSLPRGAAGGVSWPSLLAALVLSAGAVGATAAEAPDSPPVLLRSSLFLTPIETAGTGLAPEVKIRLTVDPQGRVRDPEVLSIAPSSEYDQLFRETTLETVAPWRYAPARRDGEPVEATLEWSIQFQPRSLRTSRSEVLGQTAVDREARLAQVFTLSQQQQAQRLRNFVTVADRHLAPGHRQRVATPRFVVVSDSEHAQSISTIADNLEAVFNLLEGTLGPDVEPQPAHYKLVVYVYAHQASFAGLAGELGSPEWASGLYVPPGLFAFHLDTATVDTLLGLLIHETVHSFADRHLMRPGFLLPPWMGEGLAEYFARSEIKKGRLLPGQIREGKYVIDQLRGGAYRQATAAGWNLSRAKRAVRTGEAPGVATLVGAEPEVFYGEDAAMHYALSWLLVHFLRHGEPDWTEEEFPALLLYVAEGYPAAAAIETAYGRSPAEMDELFERYVRSL